MPNGTKVEDLWGASIGASIMDDLKADMKGAVDTLIAERDSAFAQRDALAADLELANQASFELRNELSKLPSDLERVTEVARQEVKSRLGEILPPELLQKAATAVKPETTTQPQAAE